MSHSADRNLLFGILALQNNLIDRAAFLDGFNRWVADKALPMGQILVERRAMRPDDRALLEALVARHLETCGGDPRASLEALSSIGSVRQDLSRIAAPELHASLVHVAAARPDDDPYRTVSHASLGAPSALGARFRVLRPHARGGLGEVFLARDTELNRDVALKEIQDRYADDPRYRSRFEYEAEVTGGLEHPGIVPVYGLGHTPDGRPFYAMRFIRGDSLKQAIGRFHQAEGQPGRDPGHSALELRELLGRFVDVCDAVAYAHSRGVLHRDLKPGNIMLGRYGETLVVDWGLAKALEGPPEESSATPDVEPWLRPGSGSALEPTQAGSAVGTPGYMSPEQVDQRFGPLGVRSDVYCLGATLYHLLTGHAPCEADQVGEIYQKVLAGAIPRPRSLNPRLAPALEAICLKALALQPGERYATAEALKADVERWLADEPVSAWREPLATRARRWARRRRTLVMAAAASSLAATALAVLLVIGSVAAAWIYREQRDAVTTAERETAASRDRALAAQRESRAELGRTLVQQARAERLLGRDAEALADLQRASDFSERDKQFLIRALRARVLARAADLAKVLAETAAVEAEAGLAGSSDNGEALYHAAGAYALLSSRELGRAEPYASRVVRLLNQARDSGYFTTPAELAGFASDHDFDPLRRRQDLQGLVADLSFPADPFAP
jgi:serine/threonine-protein kinase